MNHRRALAAVWLLGAVPVGVLGYLAFALAETASPRRVGLLMALLACLGVLVGGAVAARPGDGLLRASLLTSLLWLLGAVLALVTMDFASDRLLLGALPAAIAAATAGLALRRLRG